MEVLSLAAVVVTRLCGAEHGRTVPEQPVVERCGKAVTMTCERIQDRELNGIACSVLVE